LSAEFPLEHVIKSLEGNAMPVGKMKVVLDGRDDNEAVMIDGHAITNVDNVPPEAVSLDIWIFPAYE
jgi:hypothetical protein